MLSENMILTVASIALVFLLVEAYFTMREYRKNQPRPDVKPEQVFNPEVPMRSELPEAWLNMPRHLEEDEIL